MQRKKIGIGAEGKLHKDFAGIIKQHEGYNNFNCIAWSYNASGEKRTAITGALLKAKGLATGWADYTFYKATNGICEVIFLEFKADKGKQADSQKEFEQKIKDSGCPNIHYYVVYSVQEALDILQKHLFFKTLK